MIFPLWEEHILYLRSDTQDVAPDLPSQWQDRRADICVELQKTTPYQGEIILSSIRKPGEELMVHPRGYLFPARLERVNRATLLLVAVRESLSAPLIKFLVAHERVRVEHPVQIPEEISLQLGYHRPGVLLEGSFPLYRNRDFFHHFLEYHSIRSAGWSKVKGW